MPNKADTPPRAKTTKRPRASFRERYDDLEERRGALIERLTAVGEPSRAHPGYKRAHTLLNDMFRKSSLAQRIGILEAASWLIGILEQMPFIT